MKKFQYILLLFLVFGKAICQERHFETPNYKTIQKNITDSKSEFYYPKLMAKYELSDTSLTLDQKRHLYYGYSFQAKYNPYEESEASKKINALIKKEKLTNEDLVEITKLSNKALKENPLDIRSLNYKLYSLEQQQKTEELEKNLIKLEIIVDALLSSGDGISKETAFYVIDPSHEYDLLAMFGFKFGGEQSLIDTYDFLSVQTNEENIEGLYFNIDPALKFLLKK